MNALLLALFLVGVGAGVLLRALGHSPKPSPKRKFPKKDGLDTVDEMFLYGEVNGDDFYRM